eukprot:204460-Hanusia_phi.AAC.3
MLENRSKEQEDRAHGEDKVVGYAVKQHHPPFTGTIRPLSLSYLPRLARTATTMTLRGIRKML